MGFLLGIDDTSIIFVGSKIACDPLLATARKVSYLQKPELDVRLLSVRISVPK